MSKIIKKTVMLNAKPEYVWDALVNPELTELYLFGGRVNSNWQTGAVIEWLGNQDEQLVVYGSGIINEIEIGSKLQYTTTNGLVTTYTLESKENETSLLSIEQGDYDTIENSQKQFDDAIVVWDNSLSALSKLFVQV